MREQMMFHAGRTALHDHLITDLSKFWEGLFFVRKGVPFGMSASDFPPIFRNMVSILIAYTKKHKERSKT